jgi:hypothetical protein
MNGNPGVTRIKHKITPRVFRAKIACRVLNSVKRRGSGRQGRACPLEGKRNLICDASYCLELHRNLLGTHGYEGHHMMGAV